MSTVLITGSEIYTDTQHFAGDSNEKFFSLTKVKTLRDPILVRWEPLKDEKVDEDVNCEAFLDRIHGWTGTGSNKIALILFDRLETLSKGAIEKANAAKPDESKGEVVGDPLPPEAMAADLNLLQKVYQGVVDGGFAVGQSYANVILIGEKACYTFQIFGDGCTVGLIRRDNPSAYGTGGTYASKMLFVTGDPIKAMWAAMWHDDKQTGGMIDIWHLPTERDPRLYRAGVCNARPLKEIKDLVHSAAIPDEPMTPDLITYESHLDKLGFVAEKSEQVGYDRATGKLPDPKNRAAIETVRTTPAQKVKKPVVKKLTSTTKKAVAARPRNRRK
jgi:hypothetical protein